MDDKLIANRIKKLRQSKNLTLESLAKMTGFTAGYISRIENSDKAPPISTMSKIAAAYEVDISFLLSEDESNNPLKMVVMRKVPDILLWRAPDEQVSVIRGIGL